MHISQYQVAGCVSIFVHGCVAVLVSLVFMTASISCALIQQPAIPLFGCLTTLMSAAHISMPLSSETLLCFLAFFFSLKTFLATFSLFTTAELQPSLVLLFRLKGKSCWSLFTLLVKTVVSIALVRFWCFVIHSIHNGMFLFSRPTAKVLSAVTSRFL